MLVNSWSRSGSSLRAMSLAYAMHDVMAMLNRSDRGTGNEIGKNDFRTNADRRRAGRAFEGGASMNQTRNDFFIVG